MTYFSLFPTAVFLHASICRNRIVIFDVDLPTVSNSEQNKSPVNINLQQWSLEYHYMS